MGHAENESTESRSNLTDVFTTLNNEKYQTALKDIIANNFDSPIEELNIKIDAASGKGDNYIGVLHRVSVEDSNGKKLDIIIKLPPLNSARREQFFARPCFTRESEFYETIYPMYQKFQEEKGIVVEEEGFYQVPVCYKSLTDDMSEGLFLEDLKVAGFEMFDRFKDITADHVLRVMEALGKFHAISLALKDQKPEMLDSYREMKDIFIQRDDESREHIKTWFDMLKKQAIEALNTFDDKTLIEKASKVLEDDFFQLLSDCIDGPGAEPYAVLSHGDCWNNNMMYRYENGIPVEVRLLDWQIMRYSSPTCDLMYYIFGCTTKALRDKHYNEFIDTYYSSLSSFLKRLGSNPENIFPREALNDQLVRFGRFGLVMAIMVLPIFTSKVEDVPDMDEMAEKFQDSKENGTKLDESIMTFTSISTVGIYNERMKGVFQDMYDLGYI